MATQTQPQIRVKSYFATSIPDAINLARRELGANALLLNSRQAPPEARHLGPLEVVFGNDSEPEKVEHVATAPPPPPPATPGIDDLRQNIEKIWNLLRTTVGSPRADGRRRLVEQVLIDAGLTPELAADIDECVTARVNRNPVADIPGPRRLFDPDVVVRETMDEIKKRFPAKPGIGKVTALAGPPGVGKTTTLVKLAMREGLMKGRSVRLVSTDAQRIAASEQLRIYAAILGVPFQSAESMSALAQAVETTPANTLLLIDTPGLSPALFDGPGSELAAFFRNRQDIDVHLVLTASTGRIDLERAADRFAAFRPSATIFTKLDETDSLGAIFCEAIRSGTPVSYFCDGQLIPENIAAATADRITESLVRQLPSLLQSAA
jgi:flagellar biosynthesis protein FlhF